MYCHIPTHVYVYSGSPVSMAIHRVGKTLLIDEFAAPMVPPTGVSVYFERTQTQSFRATFVFKYVHTYTRA